MVVQASLLEVGKVLLIKIRVYASTTLQERQKTVEYIHRLVLEAFIGPCPEGMECRHFPDRNPANNNLSNLHWGTVSENALDRAIHGTNPTGENHGRAKLTNEEVSTARELYLSGGWTYRQLADVYEISECCMWRVINRVTYK